jgi:hypothetical protein
MPKTKSELIKEWIKNENTNIATAQRASLEAKGYKELYNIQEGETTITVNTSQPPRVAQTRFGERKILRINVENQGERDLMLSSNSPLWKGIITKLNDGIITMKVVRAGTGKQTRYSVLS